MYLPRPWNLSGCCDGRLVAFAFLGEDVQQHRLVLRLQKLEGPDEQRDVVPIDRAVVTQAEFFEDDARHEQVLDAFFDLVRELHRRFFQRIASTKSRAFSCRCA